jgi:hypothetical protein
MPFYDRLCRGCSWSKVDSLELISAPDLICPVCGAVTERARLAGGTVHITRDEIPGGFIDENLGPEPVRYDSKSERRRLMKERGLVGDMDAVRHVGVQGSDKSPYTVRWDTCPAALLVSEADRIAQWHAWDREHGIVPIDRPVVIHAPEPEPVLTPEQHAAIAQLAAKVLH